MSSYNNYLHCLSVLFQGRKDGWFIPTKLATNLSISLSDTSTRKQVTQFLLYYTSSFLLDIWTWTVFYLSIYVIGGLAYLSGQKSFTLHKSRKDIELCFWFLVSSFCCKESIGYFCGLLKMWKFTYDSIISLYTGFCCRGDKLQVVCIFNIKAALWDITSLCKVYFLGKHFALFSGILCINKQDYQRMMPSVSEAILLSIMSVN